MEIVFYCIQGGTSYYSVRLNGKQIFVGAREECDRFIDIHNSKVRQEQVDATKTPRGRPVQVRTFRALRGA